MASQNPEVDLLSLDLSSESKDLEGVALDSFDEPRRRQVLIELRAMQRVLSVAEHPTHARKLMGAGYHTATKIALGTQRELAENAGLSDADAARVYARARTASLQAVNAWMAVRSAQSDRQLIRGAGAAMASKAATQLARWTELFGDATFCDCDHCHSVVGPAAYFVDLMHYVERFILDESKGVPAERQLLNRRGDLWSDKLISCKSTDEIVPTLDIVNELLERWITTKQPQWQTAPRIYSGVAATDTTNPSFALPVNFPLERLEILLAHFGLSRDRIAQALGASGAVRLNSRLRTWPDERLLIERPRPDDNTAAAYFERLFASGGVNLPNGPGRLDQTIPATFDLSWLQGSAGLDRDVLRAMLVSRYLSTDGLNVARVEVELVGRTGDVQNTMEIVKNLTRRRLDRLHRLVRFWRKLPWTVAELDYVLSRITPANVVVELTSAGVGTQPTLERIVDLLDLSDSTGLPIEEVMALWDDIPPEGFRGQVSLFDRRFNAEPFVVRSRAWPAALPIDLPLPVTGAPAPAGDSTGARLLAGLKMSDAAFSDLIESLEHVPGLVTTANGVPSSLRVSTTTLPTLYRHAALGKVLKVKPRELMRLVRLTPEIAARSAAGQIITSVADLLALQRFVVWQRASGYSSEDVAWLLDFSKRPGTEPAPAVVAARIIERIGKDHLVTFPATLFTGAGFTEGQSRQVMASLEGSAVERTVANAPAHPPTGGGAAPAVPAVAEETEYRIKKGISDAALNGFIATAIEPFVFDVAETAIFGLARRLVEFEDTVFTRLSLTDAQSKDLIRQNLDDGLSDQQAPAFRCGIRCSSDTLQAEPRLFCRAGTRGVGRAGRPGGKCDQSRRDHRA